MKKWRLLDWLLLACVLAGLAAYGLVWARWPAGFDAAKAGASAQLLKETDRNWSWRDFVAMTGDQWDAAVSGTGQGVTGLQLFSALRRPPAGRDAGGERAAADYVARPFTGGATFPERAWLLGLPLLGLLVAGWLELTVAGRRLKLARIMGMVLLVAYVWLRWRVASSETDRLAAEMQLGPGVWVLAHAVLLAGAVLLIRAAWPKSKVW